MAVAAVNLCFLGLALGTPRFNWFDVLAMGPLIAIDMLCTWLVALGLIHRAAANATSFVDITIVGPTVVSTVFVLVLVRMLVFVPPVDEVYEELIRRFVPLRAILFNGELDGIFACLHYTLWVVLAWPVAAGIGFAVWQRLIRNPDSEKQCPH